MRRVTVLVGVDHPRLRDGLVSLLNLDNFDVVGAQSGDGEALVAAAERFRPDVIITDMLRRGLSLDSKVIVLIMHGDLEMANQVLRGGAAGVLLTQSAREHLSNAICHVAQGGIYLDPELTRNAITGIAPSHRRERQLTTRQRQVLRLIVEGRRMKEIAAALQLSSRTVETHKYQMMHALGIVSTAELVKYAVEHPSIVQ